jgi:peptide/nickel transport system ATP-binding protein
VAAADEPLLGVAELSITYERHRRWPGLTSRPQLAVVRDVTFDLRARETFSLVGESGSGKSTIARAIVGLLPIASGTLLLDGRDFTSQKARRSDDYRRRVQMVFQDPRTSLNPRMTIGQTIGEILSLRDGGKRTGHRADILRLLSTVGVAASAIDRYPHQFSGGQAQRIAIARALAVRPEVLVLDEVTSALDVSAQATILNLLNQIQRDLGVSYLLISHDLSVVGYMSDYVGVMYLGRIVEMEGSAMVLGEPRHPYTQALIGSVAQVGSPASARPLTGELPDPRNPPSGCRFRTRCPVGPNAHPERLRCIEEDPSVIAESRPHHAACHFVGVRDQAAAGVDRLP